MALNSKFIPAFSINEVLVDKDTGLPLSGGVVTFYIDTQRNIKKNVYQLTGTSLNYSYTALPNPMTLAGDGTFKDSLGNPVVPYFYPFDAAGDVELYYVTVTSQAPDLVPQFVREAVPYVSPALNPGSQFENTDNELLNPQFVEVSFNPLNPLVLSVSTPNQVSPIAPDWDIVTSGTGSVTIERVAITSTNTPTNPPYVLDIQSSGITSLKLRQRLSHSPRLMANRFVSGTFVAISQDAGVPVLTMSYVPSGGTLDSTTIIQDTVDNTGYSQLVGNLSIQGIINPDPATTGYVDVLIDIPVGAHIRLSSLQIVGTSTQTDIQFDEQSTPTQINGLFHYYRDSIIMQPKKSILTGWNFSLNPWQFTTTALHTIATANAIYQADQTIIFAGSGANNIAVRRGAEVVNHAFEVVALTNTNRHAVIQYVAPQTIGEYWQHKVSGLVRAELVRTGSATTRIKMRLIYRHSLPPTLSNVEPIASWAGVDPVFAAGWTAIAPLNDPVYTLGNNFPAVAFPFDSFQLPVATNVNSTLGIVVYTLDNVDVNDTFVYNRINLVPNEFACEDAPETFDTVLKESEFYYEKSPNQGVFVGNSGFGYLIRPQLAERVIGAVDVYARSFDFEYRNIKRTANPVITLYPGDGGSANTVQVIVRVSNPRPGAAVNVLDTHISTTAWTEVVGQKSVSYFWANGNTIGVAVVGGVADVLQEAFIQFHYVIDARLGLVP